MADKKRKPDEQLTEAEILERYRGFLYQQALRFAKQGMEVEDLLQEGSIALIESFRQWRPDGGASVLTWIRHPVINAMHRTLRKHKKCAASESMDGNLQSQGTYANAGEMALNLHDLISDDKTFNYPENMLINERSATLIEKLTPREQFVINSTLRGEILADIGKVLGISRERVRQIRNKAIENIRDIHLKGCLE